MTWRNGVVGGAADGVVGGDGERGWGGLVFQG